MKKSKKEEERLPEDFNKEAEEQTAPESPPKKKEKKKKTKPSKMKAGKKLRKKEKNLNGIQKRQMSRKSANFTALCLAAVILGIGIYGTMQAYSFNSELLKAEKNISALQKLKVTETKTGTTGAQETINTPLVNQFFTGFVSQYMNVDTSKLSERETELQKYGSFTSSEAVPTQNRVLESASLYSVTAQEDFRLASFLVTYHLSGAPVTSLLNIPYTESEGLFSIVSVPYFTAVPELYGRSETLSQIDASEHSPEVENNQKELLKFLSVFFEKYAGSQTDDLKLLMKRPDYQGGNFALSQLDISAVKIFTRKDRFIVQLPVSFKDKDTNFVHTENFTLTIEKRKDGTFLVDELKHYYTEIKEK